MKDSGHQITQTADVDRGAVRRGGFGRRRGGLRVRCIGSASRDFQDRFARFLRLRGDVAHPVGLLRVGEDDDAAVRADDLHDDRGSVADRRHIARDVVIGVLFIGVGQKVGAVYRFADRQQREAARLRHLLGEDLRDVLADVGLELPVVSKG